MSSKGRGRHDGGDTDYYPTPAWCVDRLLDHSGDLLLDGVQTALEPTVGDGAIVRAVTDWQSRAPVPCRSAIDWTGVELRVGALDPRTRLAEHHEGVDFRSWRAPHPFDLGMGNPPFNVAEAVMRALLETVGVAALLLRVAILESEERVDFWRDVAPDPALLVLPQRPSFDGIGTDSCAYAWFVWGHDQIRGVHVLDPTPLDVRNAQKPTALKVGARQLDLLGGLV